MSATSNVNAQDLVIEADLGARRPHNWTRHIIINAALLWSLFQIWNASPFQFVLNSTETRSIHLGFAIFLAFLAYPAFKKSPRTRIPFTDWAFALIGAFCASYLYWFYDALATRPGLPLEVDYTLFGHAVTIPVDVLVASVGMLLLLEATRRALGPPLMIVAIVFLFYTFAGAWDYMPDMIAHKGQSLNKVASHMWLTTEGVYGIALGVSTSFVFLFVLFGSLLDKAGAGNFFIKLAFSLLGHMRGGPAKAAVLSSAMTGLISGSSIANVVTTGTFTVPLMRKVGFSKEKAGAVEVASSVNGQIMPPVMGAAAFLMVEYVGIPYIEVIKHAFLPALISYIALLYMVHLEALKANMAALPRPDMPPLKRRMLSWGIVTSSILILCGITYYALNFVKAMTGEAAIYVICAMLLITYISLLKFKSRYPDLKQDDPNADIVELPKPRDTIRTGLHYLLPIVVLVWCLMIERLSPGLSAFWAVMLMIFILVTQRPVVSWFRKQKTVMQEFVQGMHDLFDGLVVGARNMIGIGVATAAAGIIVGTVSLTGIGQVMTEIVEVLSGGSFVLVLLLTALICLILGMGLPTTANYIVVASIMTPVIVELGAQTGMVIPLIAVHLFVFYFGIMADVTPPVGLASFAAAAVSRGDPIRTGVQAFIYSSRTVILPFIFIYNGELLMVGVDSFGHGLFVFLIATVAILIFSASTQGYFIARSKIHESLLLLLVAFSLFNPQYWINQIAPPFAEAELSKLEEALSSVPADSRVRFNVLGEDEYGDPVEFFTSLTLEDASTGAEKLEKVGLFLRYEGNDVIVDDVGFNSAAEQAGFDFDYKILWLEVSQEQPNKRLVYIPAFLLLAVVIILQRRRKTSQLESA